MLKMRQYEGTNILEVTLDGDMTPDDLNKVVEKVEGMLKEHKDVRLIGIIKVIGDIESTESLQDLKSESGYIKDLSHVAVVSDHEETERICDMLGRWIPAEIVAFKTEDIKDAREWIKNA